MQKVTKYRLFNKYNLISIITLLIVLFLCWLQFSSFIEILTMDYNAPDLSGTKSEIMTLLLSQIFTWERFIDSSMYYTVFIFPIFALLPIIAFHNEKKLYFQQGFNRFKNYNKSIIKTILTYSVISGLTISLGFITYFTIGSFFMTRSLEDIGGYASILPDGFYSNHPYLFFVFMAITIYFVIGFVFGLFGCGISMLVENKYLIIVIPLIAYILDAYIIGGLGFVDLQIFRSVCSFNTILSTFESFIPIIPFLVISIILIVIGIVKNRKIINW